MNASGPVQFCQMSPNLNRTSKKRLEYGEIYMSFMQEWLVPSFKSGFISIMDQGCFVSGNKGSIYVVNGGAKNSDSNVQVLEISQLLSPQTNAAPFTSNNIYFRQNNAPIQTSRALRKFIAENKVLLWDWPAQSPDLNPIKDFWSWMKKNILKETYYKKIEPIAALYASWNRIPESYLKSLIFRMKTWIA